MTDALHVMVDPETERQRPKVGYNLKGPPFRISFHQPSPTSQCFRKFPKLHHQVGNQMFKMRPWGAVILQIRVRAASKVRQVFPSDSVVVSFLSDEGKAGPSPPHDAPTVALRETLSVSLPPFPVFSTLRLSSTVFSSPMIIPTHVFATGP